MTTPPSVAEIQRTATEAERLLYEASNLMTGWVLRVDRDDVDLQIDILLALLNGATALRIAASVAARKGADTRA